MMLPPSRPRTGEAKRPDAANKIEAESQSHNSDKPRQKGEADRSAEKGKAPYEKMKSAN